ncbi:hypothetical protein QK363_31305, partial [Pseudomonas aeruginosa]|nr:hypothetical protein [Pseudomonas aeruginosa]MDI3708022.1 hypothetical protein [Pseudomonas aeruginosa]MDI3762291.1 hypothetical protein [Pseudomonas aeruginosa]MDI3781074.1 hypothetical protein [Pseudomonas aeruginosa]MDI3871858.1 hypothetical protein [Pseudomonas aeruginosa]
AGQDGQAASAKGLMWSVHGESLADQGAISLPIALIPFRKKYSARVRGIFYFTMTPASHFAGTRLDSIQQVYQ